MSADAPAEETGGLATAAANGRLGDDLTIERPFAGDDLGRIQDILFGDHVRQIEGRFDSLSLDVQRQVADIVSDLTAQSEHQAAEIAVLHAELSEERAARLEAARMADDERTSLMRDLEGLRADHRHFVADANQRMADIAEAAAIQVNAARADFAANLDKAMASVTGSKVERDELAAMFRQGAALLEPDTESGA